MKFRNQIAFVTAVWQKKNYKALTTLKNAL